jgi:hypothetical protein
VGDGFSSFGTSGFSSVRFKKTGELSDVLKVFNGVVLYRFEVNRGISAIMSDLQKKYKFVKEYALLIKPATTAVQIGPM